MSMLGIKPVWLWTSPNNGFQPSVSDCAKLITPATRAIVLVTPNNPVRSPPPLPSPSTHSSIDRRGLHARPLAFLCGLGSC